MVACSYSPRVWGGRVGSRTRWTFFLISTAGALVVQSKGCYLPLCICCRIHFCCQVLLFPQLLTPSISGSAYRCVFFQDNQSFGWGIVDSLSLLFFTLSSVIPEMLQHMMLTNSGGSWRRTCARSLWRTVERRGPKSSFLPRRSGMRT